MFLVQKNGPKISQKIRNPSTPLYLGIIPKKSFPYFKFRMACNKSIKVVFSLSSIWPL